MEQTISQLLQGYERGKLSRRALVQGLALLAVGSAPVAAAELQSQAFNHVSLTVADVARSIEFYERVFKCVTTKRENGASLQMGMSRLVLRTGQPVGVVDHFAIGLAETFDEAAFTAEFKARGATTYKEGGGPGGELRVKDPDGYPIQLTAYKP